MNTNGQHPNPNGHKPRCTATNRQGEPCKAAARPGMTVCWSHGGNAPQVVEAADRRLHQQRLAELADMLGVPIDVDPHSALLEELHRTAGLVAWLETQARIDGRERMLVETIVGERPSGLVDLWQKERDRLVKVAAECAKAGVEERRVSIVEEQGRQVSQLIRGILRGLGVPEDERTAEVVRSQMMLVRGDPTAA